MGGQFCKNADRVSSEAELYALHAALDTGDILLFNSSSTTGCFTRCCTAMPCEAEGAKEWDHVAVVVRRRVSDGPRLGPIPNQKFYGNHKCAPGYCTCIDEAADIVEILEATAAGVHVYPLDERLAKLVNHHEYVALVKRRAPATQPHRIKLETFIRKVRGRSYEDLLNGDMVNACCGGSLCSESNQDALQEWVEDQQEKMFCSELAACSLGMLGTLKLAGFDGNGSEGAEARSFLPRDFCDETGGSRAVWNHSITSDDPMESLKLLQYPGSPYHQFLQGLKVQLLKDSQGEILHPTRSLEDSSKYGSVIESQPLMDCQANQLSLSDDDQ